tara:strand:- start:337 stop:513 length:177 start_codon:yes stop_codon:yes gene_type:complete
MTDELYLRRQFSRLKNTEYGFSIKIFDGEGNHTNNMQLDLDRAIEIVKILNERLEQCN